MDVIGVSFYRKLAPKIVILRIVLELLRHHFHVIALHLRQILHLHRQLPPN